MAESVTHTLVLQVAVPYDRLLVDFQAEVDWLGDPREVRLTDDGTTRFDLPSDGIHVGILQGEWAQYLPIRLTAVDAESGEELLLYEGIVPQERQGWFTANWAVDHAGNQAQRVSAALSGQGTLVSEGLPLAASYGWAALILLYVLAVTRRRGGDSP